MRFWKKPVNGVVNFKSYLQFSMRNVLVLQLSYNVCQTLFEYFDCFYARIHQLQQNIIKAAEHRVLGSNMLFWLKSALSPKSTVWKILALRSWFLEHIMHFLDAKIIVSSHTFKNKYITNSTTI